MTSYDIPFGSQNPRNSEGAFFALNENEIVFAYSAFIGDSWLDHMPADIRMTASRDGGETWGEPVTVARAADYRAMNVMSVSMLPMRNGDMGLFYLVRRSWTDMYSVFQRSADGGKTWSAPVRCTARDGYFVVNNDRVIRTSSSRLLVPAAEHKNKVDAEGNLHFAPAQATFFYSDDDGCTWHEAETALSLSFPACRSGLQEPGIIETSPHCLYGWARTDLGRQYEFRSEDDGITWTQAFPSPFTSPLSPLSMKRLPDGRFIAVWNPVPRSNISEENRATGNRTPLVYALSADQGKTWSAPAVIEDDPQSGYCYTAIYPTQKGVLLAYCAGNARDGGCLNRLRIRRMQLRQD